VKPTVKRRNWVYHSVVKRKPSEKKMKSINWNQMSELGLIERINREVLHPLGLAICRQVESGVSEKVIVADDGVFEYGPEINSKPLTYEQVQKKLKEFENAK